MKIYSRLIAVLAVLAMMLGLTLVGSTSATAAKDTTWGGKTAPKQTIKFKKAWGTSVTHAQNDSGYTAPIHVVCNGGKNVYLRVGQTTFLGSTEAESCPGSGVDRIIPALNQTVYCKNYVPPYENTYFYTGTNYVPSNRTYKCYMQRPI